MSTPASGSASRPTGSSVSRSNSLTRSRPTTPLRPPSRGSVRESASRASRSSASGHRHHHGASGPPSARAGAAAASSTFPLDRFEAAFEELADGAADLEANMAHFQLMHESVARFAESFASFLYGMEMNAFCVDFPEGPIPESFQRAKQAESNNRHEVEIEPTFMTTDTSFVEDPPSAAKPKPTVPAPAQRQSRMRGPRAGGSAGTASTRGGRGTTATRGDARGGTRGGRPSGLARPRGRGLR